MLFFWVIEQHLREFDTNALKTLIQRFPVTDRKFRELGEGQYVLSLKNNNIM